MPNADSLRFSIECGADEEFTVLGFEGTEEISRPYRFDIDLVSSNGSVDLDAMLGQSATLHLQSDEGKRKIHGVLSEIEQAQGGQRDLYHYKVVLVPRFALLSMSQQNQIYLGQSIPQIVNAELRGNQNNGPAHVAAAGMTSDDFDVSRLNEDYPTREYTVQYKESNLDFVSRLLEHHGICYYFVHDDDKEILFIADNQSFDPFAEESAVPFRLPSGLDSHMTQSVSSIKCRRKRILKQLMLKDYNYERPGDDLTVEATIDDQGHGIFVEHGDQFRTKDEGNPLAQVRAQELQSEQEVFTGTSDCFGFSPGHTYTLKDHFRPDFNTSYLITRVRHVGRQPNAAAVGTAMHDQLGKTYEE